MQISEDMFRFLVLSFFCFDGIVFFSSSFAQDASSESDLFFPQLELTTIRVEMSQSSLDSLLDGETITILSTPATLAGTTFITTLDGYAAVPPGT